MPLRLGRFAPSGRSVLLGVALAALAAGGYAVLRESSAFAIRHVTVTGGPPELRAQVRHALASYRGRSLLALDGDAVVARVEALPAVESASYDRAFPHTLRLRVVPETVVAVLHRGTRTWLVSARGRVVAPVRPGSQPALPRIWIPRRAAVRVGSVLGSGEGLEPARALALARRFPARIATATLAHGQLDLRLRSGLELRLGAPTDVRLKLAIARRALGALPAGTEYLDLALPTRPVAGSANPQLSSGG